VAYFSNVRPNTPRVKSELEAKVEVLTKERTGGIPPEEEEVDMEEKHMPTQLDNNKPHQTQDGNNNKKNRNGRTSK
jgi:hypothetical protein